MKICRKAYSEVEHEITRMRIISIIIIKLTSILFNLVLERVKISIWQKTWQLISAIM